MVASVGWISCFLWWASELSQGKLVTAKELLKIEEKKTKQTWEIFYYFVDKKYFGSNGFQRI